MNSSVKGNFTTYIALAIFRELVSPNLGFHSATLLITDKVFLRKYLFTRDLLTLNSLILTTQCSNGLQRCQFHLLCTPM